jgi:hypothetical protein
MPLAKAEAYAYSDKLAREGSRMSAVLQRPRLNKKKLIEEMTGKIAPPAEFTDRFISATDLTHELWQLHGVRVYPHAVALALKMPDGPPHFRMGATVYFIKAPALEYFMAKARKRRA